MSGRRFASSSRPKVRRPRLQFLLILLVGVGLGIAARDLYDPQRPLRSAELLQANQVEVCFTPAQRCAPKLIMAIHSASTHLQVRAFAFTSKPIAEALIQAHRRGVSVRVLCDPKQAQHPRSQVARLRAAGIHVRFEQLPGFAHNKVVVIDQRRVVTGSYNFTQGAELRNAENLVFLSEPATVQRYLEDWQGAWNASPDNPKADSSLPSRFGAAEKTPRIGTRQP